MSGSSVNGVQAKIKPAVPTKKLSSGEIGTALNPNFRAVWLYYRLQYQWFDRPHRRVEIDGVEWMKHLRSFYQSDTGMTLDQYKREMSYLVRIGWVERKLIEGQLYVRLTLGEPVHTCTQVGVPTHPTSVHPCTPLGAPTSPPSKEEAKEEEKEEGKEEAASPKTVPPKKVLEKKEEGLPADVLATVMQPANWKLFQKQSVHYDNPDDKAIPNHPSAKAANMYPATAMAVYVHVESMPKPQKYEWPSTTEGVVALMVQVYRQHQNNPPAAVWLEFQSYVVNGDPDAWVINAKFPNLVGKARGNPDLTDDQLAELFAKAICN